MGYYTSQTPHPEGCGRASLYLVLAVVVAVFWIGLVLYARRHF